MFCIGVYTMESVLNHCLAQFSSKYVLKEEQRQAVLGLLEQEDIVAVLPSGFGKSLIEQFVAGKLKRTLKRKEQGIIVALPCRGTMR